MKNKLPFQNVRNIAQGYTNNDRNNCTVCALASSANVSYPVATNIAQTAGRIRNKGFHSHKLIDYWNANCAKNASQKFHNVILPFSMYNPIVTLNQFLQLYPKGSFYVQKHRHAFAVVDGKVIDHPGIVSGRARIVRAWSFGFKTEVITVLPKPAPTFRVNRRGGIKKVTTKPTEFNREEFLADYKLTGKPRQKYIRCTVTGELITCFGSNLASKIKKYGSVETLLNRFVSRAGKKLIKYNRS